jgi:guanine deaminase
MSTTVTAEQYLARSIQLATANVLNSGGPFGAMIVTADGQAFDGVNRVTADNDPTAHAEVTAIRTASVGFDDAVFYEYFENRDRDSLMPVAKLELDDPQAPALLEPFNTWNTLDSRIDY